MYPNQDAIFERLETTKKLGLLSDDEVIRVARAGDLAPRFGVSLHRGPVPVDHAPIKFSEQQPCRLDQHLWPPLAALAERYAFRV